jgi:hypothetical protein
MQGPKRPCPNPQPAPGLSPSKAAKSVCRPPARPVASMPACRSGRKRAISSVVERLLHTQEVAGSNPASRIYPPQCPAPRGFGRVTRRSGRVTRKAGGLPAKVHKSFRKCSSTRTSWSAQTAIYTSAQPATSAAVSRTTRQAASPPPPTGSPFVWNTTRHAARKSRHACGKKPPNLIRARLLDILIAKERRPRSLRVGCERRRDRVRDGCGGQLR